MVAVAFSTDRTRLDVRGAHTGPGEEQRVGRRQGEPVALAIHREGLIGIGPGYLAPGVSDVVANVVAATANSRTENDVNVVHMRAKGGGHDRERCANDIRDGSPPPSVG